MASEEDPSDETLARRVQAGDRAAMDTLIRRYVRPVHAISASFLRVVRAIPRYDPPRAFAPWLYQVARNVARDQVTARGRRKDEPIGTLDAEAPGTAPDEAAALGEVRRRIEDEVARLPEQRRTAFRLVDVEGMGADEAGRLMGLAAGTVRAHVHHARRQLREALAEFAGATRQTGG